MNWIQTLWVGFGLLCSLTGQAQLDPSFSLGGGLNYALKLNTSGVNARAYINLGKHFCAGPEFTKFLKRTHSGSVQNEDHDAYEVNFVSHWVAETSEHAGVYGLVGYNFFSETITKQKTGESETHTYHGVKVGAGAHVFLGYHALFCEYNYLTSGEGDHVITLGYFYTFGGTH